MEASESRHYRRRVLRLVAGLYLLLFGAYVVYLWIAYLIYLAHLRSLAADPENLAVGGTSYLTSMTVLGLAKPIAFSILWFISWAFAHFGLHGSND